MNACLPPDVVVRQLYVTFFVPSKKSPIRWVDREVGPFLIGTDSAHNLMPLGHADRRLSAPMGRLGHSAQLRISALHTTTRTTSASAATKPDHQAASTTC